MKKDIIKENNNNNKQYENKQYEFICHKCMDWPHLAEEQNLDSSTEYLPDGLIKNLLNYKVNDKYIYIEESKKAIDFVNSIQLPKNKKIVLLNNPGCRICHNELIEPKIHYILLSGKSDIKTIQYYLFKKGIFFKEWYIKQHLTHINIYESKNIDLYSDKKILEDQIKYLHQEIMEQIELGSKANIYKLAESRKLLFNLIDYKNKNYTIINEFEDNQFTKLEDLRLKLEELKETNNKTIKIPKKQLKK